MSAKLTEESFYLEEKHANEKITFLCLFTTLNCNLIHPRLLIDANNKRSYFIKYYTFISTFNTC